MKNWTKILELTIAIYMFIISGFCLYGNIPHKHFWYWLSNIIGITLLICYQHKGEKDDTA